MSAAAFGSRRRCGSVAFTLVELLVVIGIFVLLLSVLLPSLNRARQVAARIALESERRANALEASAPSPATQPNDAASRLPLAQVKGVDADVTLTPRLSVGTVEPESIYEAKFVAKMDVKPSQAGGAAEHEVMLPLPPQIISVADLSVKINGRPSDAVSLRGDKLVWHGPLDDTAPLELDVTYTAVGKGLFTLETPPATIVDHFRISMTAAGSDVRMLELSLQPTSLTRSANATTYVWDYPKLMFGRPIALDVLGVAPIDRLGELRWLGPLSIVVLGLLIGLVAHAWNVQHFDRWLLLLVLGTFAGAYPLMYFAQEFISLRLAMLISGIGVLLIISWRTSTVMGIRLAIFGVVLPAAAVMALTLTAAVRPQLQGMLLTVLALAVFTVTMLLAPRLQVSKRSQAFEAIPPGPPDGPQLAMG